MDSATRTSTVRIRASELVGRGWLNTGGAELNLEMLRGKIVILDFWTFCCINCLHVLDELRPLEEQYKDVLVTVGVHSPKFEHEADPVALAAAVERYEIRHPVLDDPELVTWQAYSARAWPTLVVLDPEGYIVAHLSGEGHAAGLESFLTLLGIVIGVAAVIAMITIGSGTKGHADGSAAEAQFNEPQGLALLPDALAAEVGYDVVVADSVNHRLRGITLATGEVRTLAGNGVQRLLDAGPARVSEDGASTTAANLGTAPLEVALSSPWDVAYSSTLNAVVIAMAGTHQIFGFDPASGAVSIVAGNGLEGLLDGPADQAWFAQPSGVTEDAKGNIWVADSETSALRVLKFVDDGAERGNGHWRGPL